MGFTFKVEGDEILFYGENIIQVAQMSLTSPGDSRARSSKNYVTMNIVGKLHGEGGLNSETLKLFKWAQVPAEDEKAYRAVTVQVISANRCFRQIKMNKAFVVDYHERYSAGAGVGEFSLTIRQKADLVNYVEAEGGLPVDDSDIATAPGGGELGKIGEAVVRGVAQSMLNRADPSGTAAGVMRNLPRE